MKNYDERLKDAQAKLNARVELIVQGQTMIGNYGEWTDAAWGTYREAKKNIALEFDVLKDDLRK